MGSCKALISFGYTCNDICRAHEIFLEHTRCVRFFLSCTNNYVNIWTKYYFPWLVRYLFIYLLKCIRTYRNTSGCFSAWAANQLVSNRAPSCGFQPQITTGRSSFTRVRINYLPTIFIESYACSLFPEKLCGVFFFGEVMVDKKTEATIVKQPFRNDVKKKRYNW